MATLGERAVNVAVSALEIALTPRPWLEWFPWLLPTPGEAAVVATVVAIGMAIALELGWLGKGRRLKDQTIVFPLVWLYRLFRGTARRGLAVHRRRRAANPRVNPFPHALDLVEEDADGELVARPAIVYEYSCDGSGKAGWKDGGRNDGTAMGEKRSMRCSSVSSYVQSLQCGE